MNRLPILLGSFAIALVLACLALCPRAQAKSDAPVNLIRPDFPTRILPILTKAGCNAGACHGAAIGQGGFKLSLLGYDPDADFDAITRQFASRRIDLSSPAQSLILQKATRAIRHKGGERITKDSDDYNTLLNWIAQAAPYGRRDLRITSIDIHPADILLPAPGKAVQLKVTATLSDGSIEDVTAHVLYNSNDDSIAIASDDGSIELAHRGATAVMVRYAGQVAAIRVAAPMRDAQVDITSLHPRNFIDERISQVLSRMHVPPSAPCSDDEFLRRVYLDLIGRLPSPSEVRAFLAQPSTLDARQAVIDRLLARPEYADLWTLRLSDLLMIDSKRLGEGPARAYHAWLRDQIARNVPFDRIIRTLLTATGDVTRDPSANFYRLTPDPRDMGEFVSSALLGSQIACARCHAHPFAAWTQHDYYGFAAFFADLHQDGSRVLGGGPGEVTDPKTAKTLSPQLLGARDTLASGPDARAALANWLTSPHNPYFAKAIVNRIWRDLTGRGITEPVDDLRVSNPPSNPALLDALAADFVASGYDLRHLIRTIAQSSAYQLSSQSTQANLDDDRLFSHARVKPLPPQVLADAIADATAVPDIYPGYPAESRAVQLVDARTPSYALDVLGRCTRDTACDTRSRGGGVPQALHLMNGSTINAKLRGGVIDHLLSAHASDTEIVEDLYQRTLSRFPNQQERDFFAARLAAQTNNVDRRPLIEDLLWALLNSREFAYNH